MITSEGLGWADQSRGFRGRIGPLVFMILNTINGRRYIGCTGTRDALKRVRQNKDWLSAGRHHCADLQQDWDTHGADLFEFRVLRRCPHPLDVYFHQQLWMDSAARDESLYNRRRRVRRPRHSR